ncbi:hypothetical protein BDR03DRAFT_737409 [Suillus americanus]|nr:hypothetical protein BDR03DRAFT_737409 [Suillus americanus]
MVSFLPGRKLTISQSLHLQPLYPSQTQRWSKHSVLDHPCYFILVFCTRRLNYDSSATEPQLSESTKRLYTLLSTLHNLTPLPPALAGDGDTFAMKSVDVCIPGNPLNSPDSPSPTPFHLLATI